MFRKLTMSIVVVAAAIALNLSSIGLTTADSSTAVKHLQLPGYKLPYVDVGTGEPVVFVHGAIADLRTWSDYQEQVSSKHRFISYTRRYYGTQDWDVASPRYSHDQHADDLIALIESLNAGPVHLVTWSSSGATSTIAATKNPELIKSIVHFEPVFDGVMSNVPGADKLGESWGALWEPVAAAVSSGNEAEAAEKMVELVFELPAGGFKSMPKANQDLIMDNARTIELIMFNDDTQSNPDCDYLGKINTPTTVVLGADTNEWWTLMSKTIQKCMPNAILETIPGVNHAGPIFAVDEIISLLDKQIAAAK